jgi:hypothetical protein
MMMTILCYSPLKPKNVSEANIIISVCNQLKNAIMSMYEINNKVVNENPEAKAVQRKKLEERAPNWRWME